MLLVHMTTQPHMHITSSGGIDACTADAIQTLLSCIHSDRRAHPDHSLAEKLEIFAIWRNYLYIACLARHCVHGLPHLRRTGVPPSAAVPEMTGDRALGDNLSCK